MTSQKSFQDEEAQFETYGIGSAVLNVFGRFSTRTTILRDMRSIYRQKVMWVHPDKVQVDHREPATKCVKVLTLSFETSKIYAEKKGKNLRRDALEIPIPPNLKFVTELEEHGDHIS